MATAKRAHLRQTEVFEYLDDLLSSGEVNVFFATVHLRRKFGLSRRAAVPYLMEWMGSFEVRHAN